MHSSTTISKDLTSLSEAKPVLLELCETVTKRLREDQVYAQVIEVELKDSHFRRKSHQTVLDYSTNTTDDFYQISVKLFKELWDGTQSGFLEYEAANSPSTKSNRYNFSLKLPPHMKNGKKCQSSMQHWIPYKRNMGKIQ